MITRAQLEAEREALATFDDFAATKRILDLLLSIEDEGADDHAHAIGKLGDYIDGLHYGDTLAIVEIVRRS